MFLIISGSGFPFDVQCSRGVWEWLSRRINFLYVFVGFPPECQFHLATLYGFPCVVANSTYCKTKVAH